MAITQEIGHESRTKVTRQVDGVTCFPAEACADSEDDEEETEWGQVASAHVLVVEQDIDQEHQDGAGDELGEELSRLGHERGRICAENPSRRGWQADGADS